MEWILFCVVGDTLVEVTIVAPTAGQAVKLAESKGYRVTAYILSSKVESCNTNGGRIQ